MLEFDGLVISQSMTIARFIAKKVGLSGGNTPEDEAKADMIVDLVVDYYDSLKKVYFAGDDEEVKKVKAKAVFDTDVPKFLDNAEKLLREAGGRFFVGDALSWADIGMYNALEPIVDPASPTFVKRMPWFEHETRLRFLDSRPLLKALISRVEEMPAIKAYLEQRRPSEQEPF